MHALSPFPLCIPPTFLAAAVIMPVTPPPPAPPISAPVTFNGQSYNHLPADIVSGIRQLQPFPILTSRQHTALPVISFHFFPLLYYAKCHLIQIPPPPPPAVASGSAFGSC